MCLSITQIGKYCGSLYICSHFSCCYQYCGELRFKARCKNHLHLARIFDSHNQRIDRITYHLQFRFTGWKLISWIQLWENVNLSLLFPGMSQRNSFFNTFFETLHWPSWGHPKEHLCSFVHHNNFCCCEHCWCCCCSDCSCSSCCCCCCFRVAT